MTILGIVSLVFYILVVLSGKVTISNNEIAYPWRSIWWLFLYPIVGMLMTVLGLLGLVVLEPFLHFFGIQWFITMNF